MARFAVYVTCLGFIAVLTGCASHASGIAAPNMGFREVGAVCVLLEEDYVEADGHVRDREHSEAKECAGRMVYNSSRLAAFAPSERHDGFMEFAERLKGQSLDLEEACIGYDNERAMRVLADIRETCKGCHGLY